MKAEKLLRKGVLKMAPYIPGRSIEEVQEEYGVKKWIKLASNENLLGPSPKAVAAIQRELPNIYLYPEGPCTLLRQELARKFSVSEKKVVISNGAINLTLDKARVFAEVFRILRSNGRFQFADMVREHAAASACCSEGSWADCVSGTLGVEEIKTLLHEAGFAEVELVTFTGYKTSASTIGAIFRARKG